MAVAIVPKFTKAQIKKLLNDRRQAIMDAVEKRLQLIGEQFCINARTKTKEQGGFGDLSGNLRSSIGYVILYNGLQKTENYQTLKGKDGESIARKLVDEIASDFPRGMVLICVAGMDYAAYVESKGKDVISGSSDIAERELKKAMKEIQNSLNKSS